MELETSKAIKTSAKTSAKISAKISANTNLNTDMNTNIIINDKAEDTNIAANINAAANADTNIAANTNADINAAANENTNEGINEGTNKSTNEDINESTNEDINESANEGINESTNEGINEGTNKSINESINKSINKSANQNEQNDVLILAIESSCDETAASVVRNGREVLSNVISSQIALHTQFGGVVPEIASRKHIEKINQVITQALKDADVSLEDISAIGVTYGPGLVGALLVGVAEAKAIAYASHKPLVGVHHIEGHVSANYIENPDLEPPFVCLIVSGGHTHLVIVKDYGEFEIIGRTRDDAAGEAFDKVARAVGLGYPGGPKVDKAAKEGNPHAVEFPRAKVEGSPYDFSFSGLKSAVLNYINHAKMTGEDIPVPDLVASFQNAVVEALVSRAVLAAKEYGYEKLAIAGGVASNSALRQKMREECEKAGLKFYHPSPIFCTDNAAMIGVAAYYEYMKGTRHGWDLNAVPNLKLGER